MSCMNYNDRIQSQIHSALSTSLESTIGFILHSININFMKKISLPKAPSNKEKEKLFDFFSKK